MSPAIDLTGVWAADDGATYYIQQLSDGSVTWVGLNNSGFHRGIDFTNVFRGRVSSDGTMLSGSWVDVPRGESNNSGTLSLDIVPSPYGPPIGPNEFRQKADGTSGGFGGRVWTRGLSPSGPFPLGPQDIKDIESRVQRYDKPLGENNPPCRDFTVMWGSITEVYWPTLPPERTYCSFVSGWEPGDGDFSFDLTPDFSRVSAYFWIADWVEGPFDDFDGPANEHILSLFDRYKLFHCEAAMYGRENDSDHCADQPLILLPAWQENAGNSVLVNGRPINGSFVEVIVNDHRVGAPPAPYKALRFGGAVGGRQVDLTPGAVARVTGVIADDAGHEDEVAPEIHPVYAIDVVQDFGVRRPDGNVNLTGVWHANDSGTYYLHQTGNTLWWLGMSRDQGRTFANVFYGTIVGNVIEGDWVDVPIGAGGARSGGSLTLIGEALSTELTKIFQSRLFGASAWTKLYDT